MSSGTRAATATLRAQARLAPPSGPAGLPAWRLREMAATGEATAAQIVGAHLERIAEVDPALRATVTVASDAALAEAAQRDRALAAGAVPGPLWGVPFSVKDVIAVAGLPVTLGSRRFAGHVARYDAVAVARLRAAGAVPIAKTNCPEFAFGVTTSSPLRGDTSSPWGGHSPGGSSGGEAALVSARAVAFGIGTDYGGSVRWPAQCCGILGLRPAVGSVDGTGQLPEHRGRMDGGPGDGGPGNGGHGGAGADSVQRRFQVVGPLARSARDLALVWSVIADRPLPSSEPEAALRVPMSWVAAEDSQAVSDEVASVLAGQVARLRDRGVAIVAIDGLLDGLHAAFNQLRATDSLQDLRAAVGDGVDQLGEEARRVLDRAPSCDVDSQAIQDRIAQLTARVEVQLRATPLILFPVAPVAACAMDGTADVGGELLAGFALMAQCRAVTALGLSSLSIPAGVTGGDLPVSVQIVCARGREDLLFAAAGLIEATGSGTPTPPWLDPIPHQSSSEE